jgi:hypothetical protein
MSAQNQVSHSAGFATSRGSPMTQKCDPWPGPRLSVCIHPRHHQALQPHTQMAAPQ